MTRTLSAVLADYFFLDPVGSLWIEDPLAILGLVLYLVIGFTTAGIIEALHTTAHGLTQANKRLAEAEQDKDLLLREAAHLPSPVIGPRSPAGPLRRQRWSAPEIW